MRSAMVAPEANCALCDDAGTILVVDRSPQSAPHSRPPEQEVSCPARCEAYREAMRMRDQRQARLAGAGRENR